MNDFLSLFIANEFLRKVILTTIGLLVILVIVRLLRTAINTYISEQDSRAVLRKIVSAGGAFSAIFFTLAMLSTNWSQFTVALGVSGAGIAFALQEVIGSIAGWMTLTLQHFYRIGDRVQLGGIRGDVIEISILRTTLMELGQWVDGDQYNGRIVRIANSFVFKEPVFNYSADFPFLWDEILVPIQYGSDYARARQIIEQALHEVTGDYIPLAEATWADMLRKYNIETASVQPLVTLVANDNWMAFTGRYVVNYKKRRSTKDLLFTRVVELIEATEGQVELASATFQLVGTPSLPPEVPKKTAPRFSKK